MSRHRCGPRGAHRHSDRRQGHDQGHNPGALRSRLYRRSPGGAKIMGVCGGIADYFGVNAGLVRVGWLISLIMFTFPTFVGYFFLAWLLDRQPSDLFVSDEEEAFWQRVRTEPSKVLSSLKHRFRTLELRLRGLEAYVTSPGYKIDRELDDKPR